jgi:hypothetical protein
MRLDNMLVAEGVVGAENITPIESGTDQAEYMQKLQDIRQSYQEELGKYDTVLIPKLKKHTNKG